jgi:dienelactone hydrolase
MIKHIPTLFLSLIILGCTNNDSSVNTVESEPKSLEEWLAEPFDSRKSLDSFSFSKEPLAKNRVEKITNLLVQDKVEIMKTTFGADWSQRKLNYQGKVMPFYYKIFGNEPSDGRSLFISLHGGGGTTSVVNDQQYENQKNLYNQTMNTVEGVYLAARATTNTWNLWHQNHIDDFFNIIIQMAMTMENVNPNKVYLLGYSAGGDGVYQLAPRMADRWAAAAMMAGHPNDSSPLGLKNTPFALHVGALDTAYDRNLKAQQWKNLLDELESNAPGTYLHQVQIHDGLGHWMNKKDAVAIPWMKNNLRNPIPKKIVWKQDDRHHSSFYWIGTPDKLIETGGEIIAEYSTEQNEINIISNYSEILQLYVNDEMLDLDMPITIKYQGKTISQKVFKRSIYNIYKTLSLKGDPKLSFSSLITVVDNASVQE